jgi:hypothetical protein
VQVAHADTAALRLAQGRLAAAGVEEPLQDSQQTGRTADGLDYFGRKDLRSTPAWHAPGRELTHCLVEMAITHSGRESPAPLVIELRLRHRIRNQAIER